MLRRSKSACMVLRYNQDCLHSLRFIEPIEQAGVPLLVEFQAIRTRDATDGGTVPASDVVERVVWVGDVSVEIRTVLRTFVRAFVGRSYFEGMGGDTVI